MSLPARQGAHFAQRINDLKAQAVDDPHVQGFLKGVVTAIQHIESPDYGHLPLGTAHRNTPDLSDCYKKYITDGQSNDCTHRLVYRIDDTGRIELLNIGLREGDEVYAEMADILQRPTGLNVVGTSMDNYPTGHNLPATRLSNDAFIHDSREIFDGVSQMHRENYERNEANRRASVEQSRRENEARRMKVAPEARKFTERSAAERRAARAARNEARRQNQPDLSLD